MSTIKSLSLHSPLLKKLLQEQSTMIDEERTVDIKQLQEVIRHDLETLLNTKCTLLPEIDTLSWVKRSSLQYGMIDFMNLNYSSTEGKYRLCEAIKNCIELFEPRIRQCQIQVEPHSLMQAMLTIHIEGYIRIAHQQIAIYFETLLQPENRVFKVAKGQSL